MQYLQLYGELEQLLFPLSSRFLGSGLRQWLVFDKLPIRRPSLDV